MSGLDPDTTRIPFLKAIPWSKQVLFMSESLLQLPRRRKEDFAEFWEAVGKLQEVLP